MLQNVNRIEYVYSDTVNVYHVNGSHNVRKNSSHRAE